MPGLHQHFESGDTSPNPVKGLVQGIVRERSLAAIAHGNPVWGPMYDAIGGNSQYLSGLYDPHQGGTGDPSFAADAGSYYKFLPALSRGQAETGPEFPRNDFMNGTDCFPRILSLADGPWRAGSTAWDATLTWTANNGHGQVTRAMSFNQFRAASGTVQYNPYSWYNQGLGAYFTFAPQLLFMDLANKQRIWADPTAGYWRAFNNSFAEPTYLQSVATFVAVVVTAVVGGEALSSVDGTAVTAAPVAAAPAAAPVAAAAPVVTAPAAPLITASDVAVDTTAVEATAPVLSAAPIVTASTLTAADLVAPTLITGAAVDTAGGGLLSAASGALKTATQVVVAADTLKKVGATVTPPPPPPPPPNPVVTPVVKSPTAVSGTVKLAGFATLVAALGFIVWELAT